jgi:hypothetical protein
VLRSKISEVTFKNKNKIKIEKKNQLQSITFERVRFWIYNPNNREHFGIFGGA